MSEAEYAITELPLLEMKMKKLLEEYGNILLTLTISRNVITSERKIELMRRRELNHKLRAKLTVAIDKVQCGETVILAIEEFNIDEKLFEGGDSNVKYQRK